MNYSAEENFEKAKAAASLNDPESMRDLFNAATSKFYLERTAMTFDELDARGFTPILSIWTGLATALVKNGTRSKTASSARGWLLTMQSKPNA